MDNTPNTSSKAGVPMQNLSKEEMVAVLAQQTGIEVSLARDFLASNNWHLDEAIRGFKELLEKEKHSVRTAGSDPKGLRQVGRGFSVSNMQLVKEVRDHLSVDDQFYDEKHFDMFDSSSRKSFVLPDISHYDRELANFIKLDLTSVTTLQALVSAGRMNWWAEYGACRKLFPLSTVGDGNCLLHAASLGMWGFHDRMLVLRKALHQVMLHPLADKALRRRWKYSVWQDNIKCGGLTYSVAEWANEWATVVKLTSDRPRRMECGIPSRRISRQLSTPSTENVTSAVLHLNEGESLDSLESVHVYALANLLCRPIIVIAEEMLQDSHGNDLVPIPFGGIYLPMERPAEVCSKHPLVLAYHASHFSALVAADGEITYKGERLSTSIPLEDKELCTLPLRFLIDPGSTWDLVQDDGVRNEIPEPTFREKLDLLRKYLDVVKVTISSEAKGNVHGAANQNNHSVDPFLREQRDFLLAARLNVKERPVKYDEMMGNYLRNAKQRFLDSSERCLTCNRTISSNGSGFCAKCSEKREAKKNRHTPSPNQTAQPPRFVNNKLDGLASRSIAVLENIPPEPTNQISTLSYTTSHHDGVVPITDERTRPINPIGLNCRTNGCRFYGSEKTHGYCSSCYRQYQYGIQL